MSVSTTVAEWLKFIDEPMPEEAYIEYEVLMRGEEPIVGNILSRNTFLNMSGNESLTLIYGVMFHQGSGRELEDCFREWKLANADKVVVFNVPQERIEEFMNYIRNGGYADLITGDLHGPMPDTDEPVFS